MQVHILPEVEGEEGTICLLIYKSGTHNNLS
jgi:hypothetical protein